MCSLVFACGHGHVCASLCVFVCVCVSVSVCVTPPVPKGFVVLLRFQAASLRIADVPGLGFKFAIVFPLGCFVLEC